MYADDLVRLGEESNHRCIPRFPAFFRGKYTGPASVACLASLGTPPYNFLDPQQLFLYRR